MKTITALYVIGRDPEFLRESLRSVEPFVDQLVVVANQWEYGSEVALLLEEFPRAEVFKFSESFADVGERAFRAFGLAQCSSEWIMRVDSDEVLTDGWRAKADAALHAGINAMTVRFYEHMGSFEYLHRGLQQDRLLAFFRRSEIPGLTEGRDQLGTHSTFKYNGECGHCGDFAFMHYGYCKRDMVVRLANNIRRGDHTANEEEQAEAVARLERDGPWAHLPPVEPITYPEWMIPAGMRPYYGKTYRLRVNDDGKILERTIK